jgi:hypothetical protein
LEALVAGPWAGLSADSVAVWVISSVTDFIRPETRS